jgi:hypothetical protein
MPPRPLGTLALVVATLAGAPVSSGVPGPATPEAAAEEAAATLAREIAPRVEALRGLRFDHPVAVKVVDTSGARAHFESRVARLWPAEKVRSEQTALIQLGLLPAGTDLLSTFLDVLDEQVGGYYDPETETFYVLANMPPEVAPILVAHELTHALDDQHYGIDGVLEKLKDDDDRASAFDAVVEGSGTLVMTAFMIEEIKAGRMRPDVLKALQSSEAGKADKLKGAAPYLQRSLLAPYVLGLSFLLRGDVGRLAAGIDPGDLDRAFEDPPVSTEQLLHPEKYWERGRTDVPRPVPLPDLSPQLGPGWSLAAQGNLGELILAILTGVTGPDLLSPEGALPERWTNAAAAGVAGDVYHLYVNGDRSLTVLGTLWDTDADALEFQRSLRLGGGRRSFGYGPAVVIMGGDVEGRAESLAPAAVSALAAAGS